MPIDLRQLRFPGSASSTRQRMLDEDEDGNKRFDWLFDADASSTANRVVCKRACFTEDGELDPFSTYLTKHSHHRSLHSTLTGLFGSSNSPTVGPFVRTTTRDPFQYAWKFYNLRHVWDSGLEIPNLKTISFTDWLDKAKWRANQMTRMLGSNGDPRIMMTQLLHTSGRRFEIEKWGKEVFQADEYMIAQNALGSESEVLQRAIVALENMTHVGIFNRPEESLELFAFTFCLDDHTVPAQARKSAKITTVGRDFVFDVVPGLLRSNDPDISGIGFDAEKVANLIEQDNRLDILLMKRANALVDTRIADMRRLKAQGVKCHFLRKTKVTCEAEANHEEL